MNKASHTEALAASPHALGIAMLQGDSHGARLDYQAQLAAAADALADGAAAAADLQKRFPGSMPEEIARALGIAVETSNDDPMVASIWRFAEYQPRPPRIVLYKRGFARLEQALAGNLAARLLGGVSPRDVFVAHELYHHVEVIRPGLSIAQRHQATLFRIGNWRWRTGIAALSEIAAGAFAQSLLDLPSHPRVLDLIALDSFRELA